MILDKNLTQVRNKLQYLLTVGVQVIHIGMIVVEKGHVQFPMWHHGLSIIFPYSIMANKVR